MRGVTVDNINFRNAFFISTHTPHARRDPLTYFSIHEPHISTHTPHARRDNINIHAAVVPDKFQLTRLMRGVTVIFQLFHDIIAISTHTPHARRDQPYEYGHPYTKISTHTPHARRDVSGCSFKNSSNHISTHTPHARRDGEKYRPSKAQRISTHTPHARRDQLKKLMI